MMTEFTEVGLPFSWHQIEYETDDDAVEKKCFRDEYSLQPGMILDCLTNDKGRTILVVGHMNTSSGTCGCCDMNGEILFVYRVAQLELPTI
jgi:hypothetical protein